MDDRSYMDFDLVIEQVGEHYRARVVASPAGQAAAEFDSPFDPKDLTIFVLTMSQARRGMRRIDSPEMESIRTFGMRLFKSVFKDEVYACYLRSLDEMLDQNKGLRIRLRIDVPAFHDLPWEFLYNPQIGQFLALSKDTPIIRYMDLPYRTQALPVRTPMKILVMIASPEDYPALDVEEEWRRLNRALQPLMDRGQVVLQRLEQPTLSALQRHLRREQVHVFHFIGHGKYSVAQQDGMLLLENDNRRGMLTSGQQLGALLHDHHTLRLVVLNACEGARTSAEDPYTGVAQTLVRQGIPAVLAMQFEIFEQAAVTLAQEFYGAIADGYPVDAALSEARKAIFASNNDVEWGTPVLFMRIPNGLLFKPQKGGRSPKPAPEPRPAPPPEPRVNAEEELSAEVDRLYGEAQGLMKAKEWGAAADSLRQLLAKSPDDAQAKALLTEANTRLEQEVERLTRLDQQYEQGRARLEAQDYAEAIRLLEPIFQAEPDYREARALLNSAYEKKEEQDQRLAKLYDHAADLLKGKDWLTAIEALGSLEEQEPGYRNVPDLLKTARKAQAAAELAEREKTEREARDQQAREQAEREAREAAARLDAKYEQARARLDAKDYAAAIELFEEVSRADAGYKSTQELLGYAREAQQMAVRQAAEQAAREKAEREAREAAERSAREKAEREAREKKDREARERIHDALYQQARAWIQAGSFADAIIALEELEQAAPGYRDALDLLAQARLLLAAAQKPPAPRPDKPGSLPEDIKPRARPKDLPR